MRKANRTLKTVAIFLAALMIISLLPAAVFAADNGDDSKLIRAFHLDCGRKYFSVIDIEGIIDRLSQNGYSHLELAVGNDGMRFILNDMSLTVNGTTYSSADVSAAIAAGNNSYFNDPNGNALTEAEMDTLITYAAAKGIEIIPLINTPGHMDAILYAATALTGVNCAYSTSVRTIDITNATAVAFTRALLAKYIAYFASKGCSYFNMGCDEYANDVYTYGSMGFGNLVSTGRYGYFITYVNDTAAVVKEAGMTPIAFNDGFYFNGNTSSGTFDTDIMVSFWSSGWSGYTSMSATNLAARGHQILNTNGDWYYIVGNTGTQGCTKEKSVANINMTPYDSVMGSGTMTVAGAMICTWSDTPANTYSAADVYAQIDAFAAANPSVFTGPNEDAVVTSADGKVTVIAPGLVSVTAETVASPAFSSSSVEAVIGYNITPMTSSGAYTAAGLVAISVPAGWTDASRIRVWDAAEKKMLACTVESGKIVFTTSHFSEFDILFAPSANDEYVWVAVDGTVTIPVEGSVTPDTQNLDTSVAQISVSTSAGTAAHLEEATTIESGKAYYIAFQDSSNVWHFLTDGGSGVTDENKQNQATQWTFTTSGSGYTIRNGSNYLRYNSGLQISTSSTAWTCSNGNIYYYRSTGSNKGNYYIKYNGNWVAANNTTDTGAPYALIPASGPSTTVTVTGVATGETSVVIGDVTYRIIVPAEDLSDAPECPVEFWITNALVEANGATSMNLTAATAYGENGVEISTLVPASGNKQGETSVDVYWKATVLSGDNKQTTDNGVDRTQSGADFTYIRYYQGAWAYSDDRETWTTVTGDDQIVAYYLQFTQVTDEILTLVVDWGPQSNEWGGLNYLGTKYVLMDYSVKYQTGEESPAAFPTSATLAFHCDTNTTKNGVYYRSLGMIKAMNTAEYEAYMITMTPTSDTATDTLASTAAGNQNNPYTYNGTEVVVWAESQEMLDASGLGTYTSISGAFTYSIGGDAIVPGVEIYRGQGMKVTYYVRAKQTEDSLSVVYRAEKFNEELYSYHLIVNAGTTFGADFDPATGTILNATGVAQSFQLDLTQIPEAKGKYFTALYKYTGFEISEDGKTLYLDYTVPFNETIVVDFGLPVSFNYGAMIDITKVDYVEAAELKYGEVSFDAATGYLTYTPVNMINGREQITITIYFKDGSNSIVSFDLIPATTVYYEDSELFVEYEGDWDVVGTPGDISQALDFVGKGQNPYGNDPAYGNFFTYSNGSSHHTVVSADTEEIPTATFTFTGTGFDVITRTDTTAGIVIVTLYQGGEAIGRTIVDAYAGATYTVNGYYKCVWKYGSDNAWHVSRTLVEEAGEDEAQPENPTVGTTFTVYTANLEWSYPEYGTGDVSYQIPVIRNRDLEYGEYTVVISTQYSSFFDHGGAGKYDFYLDAIRIYNPAADDEGAAESYAKDNETDPEFISIREALINQGAFSADSSVNGAIYLEGGMEPTFANYEKYGPKSETILAKGQSVAFRIVTDSASSVASVMLGAKGVGKAATMTVNGQAFGIATSTEMFYKLANVTWTVSDGKLVSSLIVITNSSTEAALISLTEVKLTFSDAAPQPRMLSFMIASEDVAVAAETAQAVILAIAAPEKPIALYGDFNNDGKISGLDLAAVRRRLANINYDADAGISDEESVTPKDLLALRRYLAAYDYATGTSAFELVRP